ncbi:MAG: RelA/SpoT family protein [Anaerolineae bacterium]
MAQLPASPDSYKPVPPRAARAGKARRADSPESLAADVESLIAAARQRFPDADLSIILRAYEMAAAAHDGQRRASGEAYITHPIAVSKIVADFGLDPAAIAAALLHDVVEDTELKKGDIEAACGPEVGRLVAGLTKISAIEAREMPNSEAENLRRMFLAAVDDLRVILIKLADRLHNMQTVGALSEERRLRMALETREIYAPLANRLGIWQLKSELEDLALRQLEPDVYEAIRHEIADRRHRHEDFFAEAIRQLDERLRAVGIDAEISSRAKHISSIYDKMERKGVTADKIYDVLAVRVVVNEVAECYLALGIVHSLWSPMEGQFDDYIGKRKGNLYQSLHTSVIGPGNRPVEIQIRTHEMDEVAEYGVAAHWKYKENTASAPEIEEEIAGLRRLLKSQHEDALDAEAFVEGLKTDVFRDQVYVFTPQGEVLELPAGSTPVDFAYHIHTEVGHRCRGAMINDSIAALDTPLQTGQTVRIVTSRGDAGPSRDWLNPALGFVVSNRARAKIKQWFRRQERNQAIADGREVLERQLRRLGLTRLKHEDVSRLFDYAKLDDFLAAVGRHEIPAEAIGTRVLEGEAPEHPDQAGVTLPMPPPLHDPGSISGVTMQGADNLKTRIAGCCHPLPGEAVVGYITRGQGITLHRYDCRNIARLRDSEPDRFITVRWQQTDEHAYPVELQILAYDRPGLVRDISDVIARRGANMASISAATNPAEGSAVVTAIVRISSYSHLTGLLDKIATVENVIDVRRAAG